jgi:hypothetical protein
MITPTQDDDDGWLARMWSEAREIERRTLSNVTVTSDGVPIFEVAPTATGRPSSVIRDGAGNDLLKTDPNADWGLERPQTSHVAYSGTTSTNGTNTVFESRWEFAGYLYRINVEGAYRHGADAGSFSECQMGYRFDFVSPYTEIPGTRTITSAATAAGVIHPWTWIFDGGYVGRFISIVLQQRRSSGAGSTYCTPVYLNQY